MVRSKLIPVAVLAAVALSGVPAAFAASKKSEDSPEIAAVLSAKTTLGQAISAAEQETGGRALKAEMHNEKDTYLYEIETVAKDQLAEVLIDPATGKVTRRESKGLIAKMLDGHEQAEFDALNAAPTTLASALTAAEQHIGGTAIEGAFENEHGTSLFEIEVAKDKIMHRVKVDATTGKVMKVSTLERTNEPSEN